jgi:D-alanyl-lipoteichoic acid acyltransferase DltB (MBOAT superfamily)
VKWIIYCAHLYYFYFVILYDYGSRIAEKCYGDRRCSRYLQKSSWSGGFIDLSDGQWRDFRNSLPLLIGIAVGTSILDRICYYLKINVCYSRCVIGMVALFIQHKYHSLIILTLVLLAYAITITVKSPRTSIALTWILGVFILFFKESYLLMRYYPQHFQFLHILFDSKYTGMYGWRLPANFLVLRIISYNVDFFRHQYSRAEPEDESQELIPKKETDSHALKHKAKYPNDQLINYNLINYLSYVLYTPLYMAGPILSYHSYLNYMEQPQSTENILLYFIRFTYCYGLMEFLLTKFPFFAVIHSGLLNQLPFMEIMISFYILLKLMWLKFLLLWRFFRLWSLLDGVNPPENMLKCMSNNYSVGEFWKNWHASYNQWLIYYLYIPLGGRHYQFLNTWVIFSFVAIWHDLEWKLVCWGFMNAFFFILERLIATYFRPLFISNKKIAPDQKDEDGGKIDKINSTSSIFVQCFDAFFGALNIMALMLINLVGYSMGTGAISILWQKLFSWEGLKVISGALYFFFIGVNIMFGIEELKGKDSQKKNN